VPQEGNPTTITYSIRNPTSSERSYTYSFYIDGKLTSQGATIVPPRTIKQYSYAKPAADVWGTTTTAYIKTEDTATGQIFDASARMPPYPPEIWSSFSSFATFSSTMLSSTTTIVYYEAVIGSQMGIQLGLTISLTLIGLLIFMELSDPSYGKIGTRLAAMRKPYGILSVSLLLVFGALVLTRVFLIISGGS
jgi:hypothetical protein